MVDDMLLFLIFSGVLMEVWRKMMYAWVTHRYFVVLKEHKRLEALKALGYRMTRTEKRAFRQRVLKVLRGMDRVYMPE